MGRHYALAKLDVVSIGHAGIQVHFLRHIKCGVGLGVERRPEPGIYLHATITTDFGYRVVEIWDRREGFEAFLEKRLAPTTKALGIDKKIEITLTPLHNFFAPRLTELPGLVGELPGGPGARTS